MRVIHIELRIRGIPLNEEIYVKSNVNRESQSTDVTR